jgi:mTERF domain-containing protein, mitochondrial
MSPYLFLGKIPGLRPSLPLKFNRSATLATSDSSTQVSPPNPHFSLEYLVQSCGLSLEDALRASEHIQHLKSPDKPDAVLQFLRETGISESVIRSLVSQSPRILCSSVENNVRPNIEKFQELGFSVEDISFIISRSPRLLQFNIVEKLDFWLGVLGSVENLYVVLRWNRSLLDTNLENVIVPNLSFLLEECGLSPSQIARLIKSYSRVVMINPEVLKMNAKRAEDLGFARSSSMFMHALITISQMNRHTLDARVKNLEQLGFSQDEVAFMISKTPTLLRCSEKLVCRKMEYLINEAGCDKTDVIHNPVLLMCSLENRLIPRTVVRNLLRSKGLPVGNKAISSFMQQSEERFVEKFILPYEHIIPGLHRAYADAPSGYSAEIQYLESRT